jgi:hypothetical protein
MSRRALLRFAATAVTAGLVGIGNVGHADPAPSVVSVDAVPLTLTADEGRGVGRSSIDFALPPARGDSGVDLGLRYASDVASEGDAGVGWTLSLAAIERRLDGSEMDDGTFTDGQGKARKNTAGRSPFYFGGERLVLICNADDTPVSPKCPGASSWEPPLLEPPSGRGRSEAYGDTSLRRDPASRGA